MSKTCHLSCFKDKVQTVRSAVVQHISVQSSVSVWMAGVLARSSWLVYPVYPDICPTSCGSRPQTHIKPWQHQLKSSMSGLVKRAMLMSACVVTSKERKTQALCAYNTFPLINYLIIMSYFTVLSSITVYEYMMTEPMWQPSCLHTIRPLELNVFKD